jgi:glycerol-3-phosphate acyltransferase PlsY
MTVAIWIGCAVVCYLLGSIPTGFVWGQLRGMDIRKVGSGNIGATNVMRALGTGPGVTVLLIDALKGWLPVWLAPRVFPELDRSALQILCTVAVVAGHNWTCWLKFKGGKGVATSAGALLAMVPGPLVCALAVWGIVFGLSRYVSLASIAASVAVPVATWFLTHDVKLFVFAAIIGLLAVYRHKSNIQRLLAGTENRIGRKKA